MLCIVGLPSSLSSKYLPPHGENNLIRNLTPFSKASFEVSGNSPVSQDAFCSTVTEAIKALYSGPNGPVVLGVPQNYMESLWLDKDEMIGHISKLIRSVNEKDVPEPDDEILIRCIDMIESKRNIVILVDDFFLKSGSTELLKKFSEAMDADVLQLEYRRGPVFFEQLDKTRSQNFKGFYDPNNGEHKGLLGNADLIITLEDRNMYTRNIGEFPDVNKIAFTSNKAMTLKNEYIGTEDLLIAGKVDKIIESLLQKLGEKTRKREVVDKNREVFSTQNKFGKYHFLREELPKVISESIQSFKRIAWVDDGQIFGSILKENYRSLPQGLRVFGDHGGFVGAGMGYACGLAVKPEFDLVVCTIGDHGFCNGFQSLYTANDIVSKIIFFVFNNGKSVSLLTQSEYNGLENILNSKFLCNLSGLNYTEMAKSVGLKAFSIDISKEDPIDGNEVKERIRELVESNHAVLIEFKCPQEINAYNALWACKGLDEK
jgi:acetolactate synthase-1/2/3 large subunit